MAFTIPRLDHLVIDVRDRMDEAEKVFRSLGFQLTARSRHTLGSFNRLAVFDSDYLELLGIDADVPVVRADIARFPVGLNGLVFGADQAESVSSALHTNGVPVEEPVAFSRTVKLAEGSREARFRVVRLPAGTVSFGRVYFCQHLTPELVWRREWQQHANGALAIRRVIIAVRDAHASMLLFRDMFGSGCVRVRPGGAWELRAGDVRIEFVSQAIVTRRLGDAAPDAAGRDDYMAAVSIRTRSLSQAARALRSGGIASLRVEPLRIVVPANQAMNVALEFTE
jgi:glyoxalase-like protein